MLETGVTAWKRLSGDGSSASFLCKCPGAVERLFKMFTERLELCSRLVRLLACTGFALYAGYRAFLLPVGRAADLGIIAMIALFAITLLLVGLVSFLDDQKRAQSE